MSVDKMIHSLWPVNLNAQFVPHDCQVRFSTHDQFYRLLYTARTSKSARMAPDTNAYVGWAQEDWYGTDFEDAYLKDL